MAMDAGGSGARGVRGLWPAPSFFASRPLMTAIVLFVLGVSASARIPQWPALWGVPGLLCGLGIWLGRRRRRLAFALVLAAAFCLGALRGGMALRAPDLPPTGKWVVQGTVAGAPTENDRAAMLFLTDVRMRAPEDAGWTPIQGKVYCYCPFEEAMPMPDLVHGARVEVRGSSYLPQGRRNPGGFDQRMWLAQNGAHVRMYAAQTPDLLEAAKWSVRGFAISVSQALGARVDMAFGLAAPVVRAMLLGDQRAMPDIWMGWMRDSGIAHVLAVSGLHVGLWYLLLERLLRPFSLSPRMRFAGLTVLLCTYALLTGLKPSVLRAVVMVLMLQAGRVAGRKPDPMTTVAVAAALILCTRPLDLFHVGFQLSFCAVLGIILVRPAVRRLLPARPEAVFGGLSVTLAAQLGMLPPYAHAFGRLSMPGLLLNLLAVPLTGFLIPVAALGLALGAVWTPLGTPFVMAAKGMVIALMYMARFAAELPFGAVRIGAFAWWTAAAFGLFLFLCASCVTWSLRRRVAAVAMTGALAVCAGYLSGAHLPRYVQLDVGHALSGVLHAQGKTVVYDCGNEGSDLLHYLWYTGDAVDALFVSHPHMDHMGGLMDLLEADMDIGAIYVPAAADAFGADEGYAQRLALAEAKGIPVVALSAGDRLDVGGISVEVIAPEKAVTRGNSPNDRSLILRVAVAGQTLLLTGDADGAAEPQGVSADILQVAHHGSRQAAGEAFLEDVSPEVALISAGRNGYGHPAEETLERLFASGAAVYVTQASGALTVVLEPDGLLIKEYCAP